MAKIVEAGSLPVAKQNITFARMPADAVAVGTLLLLTALVSWERLAGGWALQRLDTVTIFIPMYGFLGEQLRSGNIPGWNPYQFSSAAYRLRAIPNPAGCICQQWSSLRCSPRSQHSRR